MTKHVLNGKSIRKVAGFTLVELMIVVLIVGVLAAVAYPSYRESSRRSNRTEAKALLADAAARQERFFSDFNTYTTYMTALNYAADPAISENAYYQLDAVAGVTGIRTSFQLEATVRDPGGQSDDTECWKMTLDNLGQKRSQDDGGNANPAPPNEPCW